MPHSWIHIADESKLVKQGSNLSGSGQLSKRSDKDGLANTLIPGSLGLPPIPATGSMKINK